MQTDQGIYCAFLGSYTYKAIVQVNSDSRQQIDIFHTKKRFPV